MCGIAGWVNRNGANPDKQVLNLMADALSLRGPDGHGVHIHDNLGLVHTRLAIIDPNAGAQPMFSADKNIGITFNGEIYNFRELRSELESKGYTFNTHSDTEVIIYAWKEWGTSCVQRLRGMFAFCIADFNNRLLFIARDPMGIKPLVYYHDDQNFAFASEIQALKKLPGFNKEISLQSLDYYLWLSYIPAPHSIYKNVKKLPPAHCMTVSFSGEIKSIEKYWQLQFNPNHTIKINDWPALAEARLKESVKAHLVSDVPFGAFLSGGIDSTLVVQYMAEQLNQPVKAFTISFEEDAFNELPYAEQAAKILGVEHHQEVVKPEALKILPDLVKHYGEPYADSSAIPTYYVCRLARKHVTMVLSGDGGDEAFFGYPRYQQWLKYLNTRLNVPAWKALLLPLAHAINPERYSPLTPTKNTYSFLRFTEYLKLPVRQQLWRSEFHRNINKRWPEMEGEFEQTQGADLLNRGKYLDQKSYMVYDILAKVDGASMMNSLEVRTPIIDKEVFEFAATIPPEVMFNQVQQQPPTEKYLLKKLLERRFPKDFVHRRKAGFSMPLAKWFNQTDGALFKEVSERLCDPQSPLRTYFTEEGINTILFTRNYPRHIGDSEPIWQLLFLDEWLRQNK